ncbi:MAG: ankyrin repeat domain-containing protein [Pseudomonadota bacterium]
MNTHDDSRSPGDELTRRYREASQQDMGRPGAHVRQAVQAHAAAVLAANSQNIAAAGKPPEAANQPRWKVSMLASIALAGLTGLVVLQFDRGTPEEKEIAMGQPEAARVPPATPVAPAPATRAPAQTETRANTKAAAPAKPSAQAVPLPSPPERRDNALAKAAPVQDSVASSGSVAREAGAPAAPAAAMTPSPFPLSTPPQVAPPAPAPFTVPRAAPAPALGMQRADSMAAPAARLREQAGSTNLQASLLQAARSGRVAEIEQLLQQGAPINSIDSMGRTPLMLAVINGHEPAVQRLLQLGASSALRDPDGFNALEQARRLGLERIAALLEAQQPAR